MLRYRVCIAGIFSGAQEAAEVVVVADARGESVPAAICGTGRLAAPYYAHMRITAMLHAVRRTFGWFVVLAACMVSPCLRAQTPIVEEPDYKPTLTFDVVVIRLAPPPGVNFHVAVSSPANSSRFDATNLPMKTLLQIAYGFDAPVVGLPDWAADTFYNIQARSDDATDARLAKLPENEVRLEKRNAIRVLLADRMSLKTHLETRNSAIFNLVVGKGGLKMQTAPAPPAQERGEAPAPVPVANVATHASMHGLEFVGTNSSMRAITAALSAMVEQPVLDRTGLTGTYNYTLQFGREWSARDPESWPSIFTAVQEQLGLKLEAVHEAVPNLVVDRMTKPTEN